MHEDSAKKIYSNYKKKKNKKVLMNRIDTQRYLNA